MLCRDKFSKNDRFFSFCGFTLRINFLRQIDSWSILTSDPNLIEIPDMEMRETFAHINFWHDHFSWLGWMNKNEFRTIQFITGKSWIFFDHFFLNVRPVKIGKISLISGVNNSPKNAWLETFLSSHTCVYEKRNGMRGFLHNSLSPLFTAKTLSHINIQVSLLYPKVTSQRNHYERHALTFNGKNVIVNYGIKRKRTEEKSQFESVKSVDRKSFSYSCFRN